MGYRLPLSSTNTLPGHFLLNRHALTDPPNPVPITIASKCWINVDTSPKRSWLNEVVVSSKHFGPFVKLGTVVSTPPQMR